MVDTAYVAVLEEAGWELRQVLTQLRGRLELAQMKGQTGQPTLSVEEIGRMLEGIERASTILDVSLDRNETAKQLIPIQDEAFDLTEKLRDWLAREALDDEIELPMEPAPVRGDPVKLPKAVGSMVEFFASEAQPGERVVGEVKWEGDKIRGFVGLSPSHMEVAKLMEQVASPLPVGALQFNLALVRAIIERHGGVLRVATWGEDAVGFGFELDALDLEVGSP